MINEDEPEIVLETDEELKEDDNGVQLVFPSGAIALGRFEQELERYRSEDRPNHCHHEGSYLHLHLHLFS